MKGVFRSAWLGPLVALVAVYLFFLIWTPATFARPDILVTMARQTVVVAVCSIGMTLVIGHGGIDLSVGSIVALTTVVMARLLRAGNGPASVAMVGIACASAAGFGNGLLITRLRVAPFIVTLGSMSILRGLAKGLADEQKIDCETRGIEALTDPRSAFVLPSSVWLALGLALLFAAVLRYSRFGRHLFAVGSNEQAARLAGVGVGSTKLLVYTLAGMFAGVAGLVELSTLTVGDPTDSIGLELSVIASVVIGGASLSGGEGSIPGALVGAFLMTLIKTGCTHVGVQNWVQEIITGVIIVMAVALDRLKHARR
jgi:ribose transport system permease protein